MFFNILQNEIWNFSRILNLLSKSFLVLQAEMVLAGENSTHREPFESFVKEYLETGRDILTINIYLDFTSLQRFETFNIAF